MNYSSKQRVVIVVIKEKLNRKLLEYFKERYLNNLLLSLYFFMSIALKHGVADMYTLGSHLMSRCDSRTREIR